MSQRVQIILEDDLDGGDADETITFALDGSTYEIDLSEANAKELRNVMSTYLEHGRRKSRSRRARASSSDRTAGGINGHSTKEIRDWARSNGHTLPEHGRIPVAVREAFSAAH